MHIFQQYYGLHQYFIVYRFLSERKRQVVIQQTRFLSTIFLRSEFKLENIYSGVNLYGNFYLRELTQKLEPAKFRATRYVSFCINRFKVSPRTSQSIRMVLYFILLEIGD